MNTRAIYGTVRKYGYLIVETSTSLSSDEAHVFDDSDSHIDSNDQGLNGTSQELRDVMNFSPNTDWLVVTSTTTEYSFTAEKKMVSKVSTLFCHLIFSFKL